MAIINLDWPSAAVILGLAGLWVYHSNAQRSCVCRECGAGGGGHMRKSRTPSISPVQSAPSVPSVTPSVAPSESFAPSIPSTSLHSAHSVHSVPSVPSLSPSEVGDLRLQYPTPSRSASVSPALPSRGGTPSQLHSGVSSLRTPTPPSATEWKEASSGFNSVANGSDSADAHPSDAHPLDGWDPTSAGYAPGARASAAAYENTLPAAIPRRPRSPSASVGSWSARLGRDDPSPPQPPTAKPQRPSDIPPRDVTHFSAELLRDRAFKMARFGKWECPVCGLLHREEAALREHIDDRHDGDATAVVLLHSCKLCSDERTYKSYKFLAQHLRDKHSITSEPSSEFDSVRCVQCPGRKFRTLQHAIQHHMHGRCTTLSGRVRDDYRHDYREPHRTSGDSSETETEDEHMPSNGWEWVTDAAAPAPLSPAPTLPNIHDMSDTESVAEPPRSWSTVVKEMVEAGETEAREAEEVRHEEPEHVGDAASPVQPIAEVSEDEGEDERSVVTSETGDESSLDTDDGPVSQDDTQEDSHSPSSPVPLSTPSKTVASLAPAFEHKAPVDLLGFGTPGPTAPSASESRSSGEPTSPSSPYSPSRHDTSTDLFAFTPTPHKFGWSRPESSPRGPESPSAARSPPASPLLSRISSAPRGSPSLPPRSPTEYGNPYASQGGSALERTLSSSSTSSIWGPPEHTFGRVIIPPVPATGPVANPRAHIGWENWKTLPDEQTNKPNSLMEKKVDPEPSAEDKPQLEDKFRLTSIVRPSPSPSPASPRSSRASRRGSRSTPRARAARATRRAPAARPPSAAVVDLQARSASATRRRPAPAGRGGIPVRRLRIGAPQSLRP